MKIALGSDHNGVRVKELLKIHLSSKHHGVVDVGPNDSDSDDYPDFAFAASEMVSEKNADRAILICGSGVGMSMAANKVVGIRAALCFSPQAAKLARQHNDANVLALAGWQSNESDVLAIVDVFLTTEFEGGRHARRVDKIIAYEKRRGME